MSLLACRSSTPGEGRATNCAFQLTWMRARVKMFSSVRVRLTLWYTSILALALVAFSLAGYFFLSYTLNRRTDDALGEMANAFAATLANDEGDSHRGEANPVRGEDRSNTPDEAVIEALSQNQFRDSQLVVYTEGRREVAAAVQNNGKPPRWTRPVVSKLAGVLDAFCRNPNAALYV